VCMIVLPYDCTAYDSKLERMLRQPRPAGTIGSAGPYARPILLADRR